ncbi:MAG TPA: hypothetical protein PKG52_00395 [bacterium]|nr:hypothetical protein [bacterium]HPS28997.1 hypothetical protein [bacterium]
MKKSLMVFILAVSFPFLSVSAKDSWSSQKTDGIASVCYQNSSMMYCAYTENKKGGETDLKNYLSVFLQFGGYDVTLSEMVLQPGIVRLIKGSRPEQYDRVLRGVFDYLLREKKRFAISISSGSDLTGQTKFSETDLVDIIEAVSWPKYIDSAIDSITCTEDSKITLNLKMTNSMKKPFLFFADESEVRVLGGRGDILSVGSIAPEHRKIEIKAGETADYSISIIFTGEMDKATRYAIVPFIKNIRISKDESFVLCKQP